MDYSHPLKTISLLSWVLCRCTWVSDHHEHLEQQKLCLLIFILPGRSQYYLWNDFIQESVNPRVYIFSVPSVTWYLPTHPRCLVVYKWQWTSVSLSDSEVRWRWLLRRLALCPYTAWPLFLLLAYVHAFLSDISDWSLGLKKQSIWRIWGIQWTRHTSICTLVFMRFNLSHGEGLIKNLK